MLCCRQISNLRCRQMRIKGEHGEVLLLPNFLHWVESSIESNLYRVLYMGDQNEPEPLHNGDLACMWFTSACTRMWGLSSEPHTWVDHGVAHHLNCGWRLTHHARPGCLIVWGPRPGGTHKHIGILLSAKEAVSNSSAVRQPQRHSTNLPRRTRLALLEHPLLHSEKA